MTAGGSGWNVYMRAAQFADCTKFNPPAGTRVLCDHTAVSQREGPGYYRWLGGPAYRAFGVDHHDRQVGEFALAAIVHQPLAYARLVFTDVVHYVDPEFGGVRLADFAGPVSVRFPAGIPVPDPALKAEITAYYGAVRSTLRPVSPLLHDLQGFLRLSGPMLLLAVAVALVGAFMSSGAERWGIVLMLGIALELILLPTLTAATWRYAVPAVGPLFAAAALGVRRLPLRIDVRLELPRHRHRLDT